MLDNLIIIFKIINQNNQLRLAITMNYYDNKSIKESLNTKSN